MAYGDPNDFGWCNLIIKFLLVVINVIVWLIGTALMGGGIYALTAPETNLSDLNVGNFLTTPAIFLTIIGGVLFILGFCGCFGALLELYVLLLVYTAVLSILVLAEIALVVYVYLQQDSAYETLEETLREAVVEYYDDADKRSIIDSVQSELFRCCGVNSPMDWELNPYFNCSSKAFQKCSVPYSCCDLEDGSIVNVQCGYRSLDPMAENYYLGANPTIYTRGCVGAFRSLLRGNINTLLGVGVGLLIFQLVNIMLAGGLAIDIRKEKLAIKTIKHRQLQSNY